MQEAVSDILAERARISIGISRMLMASLAAHAVLIAALLLAPGFFTGVSVNQETPMMLVLGGVEGPDAGGRTMLSNRPVQRVAEPEEKPSRPTPPAAKTPEMTAPEPTAKPAPKTPPKPVEKPRETSSTRKPTSGEEIKSGAARAETGGAAVPFGGLSTGGGGTGGYRTDVQNFCCPRYLADVVNLIRRNWNNRRGVAGRNTIRFVIHRDGRISNVAVDESGGALLDIASQSALSVTREVPPLPPEFTGNTLTVYLTFEYTR